MSKIKINIANGSQVEKPLVIAFKGASGDYLILDNETNGQMGYPIICISRLNANTAEKIIDQSEWNAVKESLKKIISGNLPVFLKVPEELSANEDFFTQLTLPVASFDLLKKAYAVPEAPVQVETPAVAQTPDATQTPAVEVAPPVENTPAPLPSAPVTVGQTETSVQPIPQVQTPAPVAQIAAPMPVAEVAPPVESAPSANSDIQTIKDTFLKSCENMFDALLKQMENK